MFHHGVTAYMRTLRFIFTCTTSLSNFPKEHIRLENCLVNKHVITEYILPYPKSKDIDTFTFHLHVIYTILSI